MVQPGDLLEGPSILGMLWRIVKPPHVTLLPPVDLANERAYCWWHVRVSNMPRYRWVVSNPALRCTVTMDITEPGGKKSSVQGMWATLNGPQQYAALVVGEQPAEIPIALRFPPTIKRGGWDPDDDQTPFISYLTDSEYLVTVGHSAHYGVPWIRPGDSGLLPGVYYINVVIRSGHKVYASRPFTLTVPMSRLVGFSLEAH